MKINYQKNLKILFKAISWILTAVVLQTFVLVFVQSRYNLAMEKIAESDPNFNKTMENIQSIIDVFQRIDASFIIILIIVSFFSVLVFLAIRWHVKDAIKIRMSKIEKQVNNVVESNSITAIFAGITNRFTRDVLMPQINEDQLINFLLDNDYKLSDIEVYGFDREFQRKFYIEATQRKLKWAKKIKFKDEHNRDNEQIPDGA